MEDGIKYEPKQAAAATASQQTTAAVSATTGTATVGDRADATFKSLADVLKLLPTSTFIVYEVLNPIVTNAGDCGTANRAITSVLLVLCAVSCAFSAFTDSYLGADGKARYGLVTAKGFLPFGGVDDGDNGRDFSKHRLRVADFVHAVFSVVVFAAVALLADANTVACFYPGLRAQQKQMVMALPAVVGAVASVVFVVFPCMRHGIGYRYPPVKPVASSLA